jgi:hypothetical protein
MIRVHQGKLAYGFTPGAHPDNRQPQCQTASATSTQAAFTETASMCQQHALSPRPKGRGTLRLLVGNLFGGLIEG